MDLKYGDYILSIRENTFGEFVISSYIIYHNGFPAYGFEDYKTALKWLKNKNIISNDEYTFQISKDWS